MKVTLLIPTLNEAVGMRSIMPKVKKEWVDQILIVDGKSKDGTADIAREMGYDVVIQQTPGIRGAYMDALPFIKGDIILTFSPDGNSIPELIPVCIAKVKEGYDMVIVSRYAQGAKSYDDDMVTAFGNRLFTGCINLLHGAKYTDAMVIYRAYPKKLIYDLALDKDSSYSFEEKLFRTKISWEPLLSIRAAKRRLQVLKWGAAYMFEIWREIFIWR